MIRRIEDMDIVVRILVLVELGHYAHLRIMIRT